MHRVGFIVATLIWLAVAAPAADKMDKIPVQIHLFRVTQQITTPQSTLATLMSNLVKEVFTTSLSNLSTDPTTKILSLYGSMEGQDAHL